MPKPSAIEIQSGNDSTLTQTSAAENADAATRFTRRTLGLVIGASLLVVLIIGLVGFRALYAGKIYPGVSAEGVYLSGLTKDGAVALLTKQAAALQSNQLNITYGNTHLNIPVGQLGVTYDPNAAAEAAYAYGRAGWCWDCLIEQVRVLFGRSTIRTVMRLDDTKLTPFLAQVAASVERPVANASLDFNNQISVRPAQIGRRLDGGELVLLIADRLNRANESAVAAPVYDLAPVIDDASLAAVQNRAAGYLAEPMLLKLGTDLKTITQAQIAGWIKVNRTPDSVVNIPTITSFYPLPPDPSLQLDQAAVAAYVSHVAAATDQSAQDAALTIQNGKAVVFQPSHTGMKLDQASAVSAITAAVAKTGEGRTVTLNVAVTQPIVREDTLNSLGINELISEGQTTFPGSPSNRITNVRVGASKFNGVLLKPGDTFSFGALLGDVGPAQGYLPGLIILGNHEELQYGGGLCQVSTTAYRAALLAGLPIVERHNHSFAVSYYTAPYGVPGVDATIYYPDVDFKFLNDTGSYILIQTIMSGTTLTFDFYGTKKKYGQVRGPFFVSGSNDATKPSQTVFYRDTFDLAGTLLKTDTVNTWYQSSLDFPITKQYN